MAVDDQTVAYKKLRHATVAGSDKAACWIGLDAPDEHSLVVSFDVGQRGASGWHLRVSDSFVYLAFAIFEKIEV